MSVSTRTAETTVVAEWIEAVNARSLERLLACVTEDVDFRPLRLSGVPTRYADREGLRRWFGQFRRLDHAYRIVVGEIRELGRGRVFASGSLCTEGGAPLAPFWALYTLDGGRIASAREYVTDPEIVDWLGLIT